MPYSVIGEATASYQFFKRKIKLSGKTFLPSHRHHHHRPNQSGGGGWGGGEGDKAHGIFRGRVSFSVGSNARSGQNYLKALESEAKCGEN